MSDRAPETSRAGDGRPRGPRGLRGLLAATDGVAKAALVAMAAFVCLEVLCRALLGTSTQMAEEVASLALVLLLFLGLPGAFADDALLRVQALHDRLGGRARRIADLLFLAAALAVTLVYLWQAVLLALSSRAKGIVTDTVLATPVFLPQIAMAAGLAVLALAILARLVRTARGAGAR